VQLRRAQVGLGPESHGSWVARGHGFEADVFMVVLVHKVGGARNVVKDRGWPDGIVSVRHESEETGIGGREQVCDLCLVSGKVLVGAFRLCPWRGPRGDAHVR